GMVASTTSLAIVNRSSDRAVGYHEPRTELQRETEHDLANVAPAGGIHSSARDLGQWLRLMVSEGTIDGRRVVSRKGYLELVTPQNAIEPDEAYGLGWELGSANGFPQLRHDGGGVGYASRVWISPEQHLAWAVLANVNMSPEFREIANTVN